MVILRRVTNAGNGCRLLGQQVHFPHLVESGHGDVELAFGYQQSSGAVDGTSSAKHFLRGNQCSLSRPQYSGHLAGAQVHCANGMVVRICDIQHVGLLVQRQSRWPVEAGVVDVPVLEPAYVLADARVNFSVEVHQQDAITLLVRDVKTAFITGIHQVGGRGNQFLGQAVDQHLFARNRTRGAQRKDGFTGQVTDGWHRFVHARVA